MMCEKHFVTLGDYYDHCRLSHPGMRHLANDVTGKPIGTKHDAGKVRWSLLPAGTISMVLQVLEYGAAKYDIDNWMHVKDHRRRYYDAAMRHINSWLDEPNDPESGLHHLAHAVCCLLFLMWFDKNEVK